MLHARADYNRRIQDSDEIIPTDEPVFLLRSTDKHMAAMLERYADLVEAEEGHDPTIVENTLRHIDRVHEWQDEHPPKSPDMDPADSVMD